MTPQLARGFPFFQATKLGLANLLIIVGALPKLEAGHERPDDEDLVLRQLQHEQRKRVWRQRALLPPLGPR